MLAPAKWMLDINTLSSPVATLSTDCLTITKGVSTGYVSICGNKEFGPGSKTIWRVRIDRLTKLWMTIGVSPLKKHPDTTYNGEFFGWTASGYSSFGGALAFVSADFAEGDTVEVTLDCVQWTLQLRNPRTGTILLMQGLPPGKYAPHFNLHYANTSITVIPN
jgi:hypothetical protein